MSKAASMIGVYIICLMVFTSVMIKVNRNSMEELEHTAFRIGCMDSGKLNKTECEALYKERK